MLVRNKTVTRSNLKSSLFQALVQNSTRIGTFLRPSNEQEHAVAFNVYKVSYSVVYETFVNMLQFIM